MGVNLGAKFKTEAEGNALSPSMPLDANNGKTHMIRELAACQYVGTQP